MSKQKLDNLKSQVKKIKESTRYSSQSFLNKIKPETGLTSSIGCYINFDDYIPCSLEIRDCNSKVTLDIDLDSKEEYQNTINKLSILIKELNNYRAKVIDSYPKYKKLNELNDQIRDLKLKIEVENEN